MPSNKKFLVFARSKGQNLRLEIYFQRIKVNLKMQGMGFRADKILNKRTEYFNTDHRNSYKQNGYKEN